jgi:hypothetical protein
MSSRSNRLNLIDHTLRHTLRRSVERVQPGPATRQRLLQRAARQSWALRWWLAVSEPVTEYHRAGGPTPLELGWRELAFVQILRPAGVFGSMSQLR